MSCIYMYTNKINGMKYIGQTNNVVRRKSQHRNMYDKNNYFDRALNKYGEENFEFTILEKDIPSDKVDQREQYYIEKYDTFNNGYNLTRGGQNNKTYFNEQDRDKIVSLLKSSSFSMAEIGEKTGYSVYTVSDVNKGKTLPRSDIEYPIRDERCCEKFTNDDIDNVIYFLQNTTYNMCKIAELTNTNFNFVYDINRGKRTKLPNIQFPIRKMHKRVKVSIELAKTIIEYLKTKNMSAEEIGNTLGIPGYTVGSINKGKHSVCKNIVEDYPIRKKQYKSHTNYIGRKLTEENVKEIVELLLNTGLSTEEISRRFDVDRTAIDRINRGATFKKELTNFKFPLRQNKDYNLYMVA